MEEQDVARVEEERRRGREGRQGPEAPGDAEPGDEREAVEDRRAGLGGDRPRLEEHAGDERRARRPREQRVREDDVGVEELGVVEEVSRQVAARLEREAERDEPVDDERGREQGGRGEPALREALGGALGTNDRAL